MQSLRELRRAAAILEERLSGARLMRSLQPDRYELVLVFEARGRDGRRRREAVLLSCRPKRARLSLLDAVPEAPKTLTSLPQYLRAHARGLQLEAIAVAPADRIARLRLTGPDAPSEVILAIMGGRSNVYVLDGEGRVRIALRPIAQTRRDLDLGAVWQDPEGPPRAEGEDRFEALPDAELFVALERLAAEGESQGGAQERVRKLRRLLRRRSQGLARKVTGLEVDAAAGERAVQLERAGQLLKVNLRRVTRGADSLRVEDPAEEGSSVDIPLDPALGPKENLEAIFGRYRKELRRASRAGEEIDAARERLARMQALMSTLESFGESPDGATLDAFEAEPEVVRLLERAKPSQTPGLQRPRRSGAGGVSARLLPKRYRSTTGLEIWVGKSDAGNDHLSTRLARGNDLFFHLEGSPGSHVVLRTEGRSDPPAEALLEACELAVFFSRQKGSSRAGVHVAPIKQVRKPSRAKPGLVTVYGGRTVALRHDPARLRRVLEARIPDER